MLKIQQQSREDSSLYAKKSDHVSLELETLVLEEKVKRMFREECMKIGMEEGVKRGIEQGIEQARKIFHLYLSGRSEEDIAKETGIPKEDIVFALDAIQSPLSLYDPVYTDGGDALYVMDQISDKKNKEEKWIEELSLGDAMDRLNERENYIIRLRFFEGKTQMEVAEEIHISQAQVSRLEKSALKSMKNYLSV